MINQVRVYIAFEEAFSLNVINGSFQVLLVNVLTYEEEVLFICLDRHVSCHVYMTEAFLSTFFFCVVQTPLALIWWSK